MDLDLEQMKNDFLPLIAGIKQEQLDVVPTDVLPQISLNNMGATATASNGGAPTTSTSSSSTSSVSNPCDSAEKRVSGFPTCCELF